MNSDEHGIYIEIFAAKDGKRINLKIVSLRQLSKALTNGLMNAIEEIVEIEPTEEDPDGQDVHQVLL